jgi:hypothetical protein
MGDFARLLSEEQADALRLRGLSLLRELRPDAVALTDSFDFTDWHLNSALGRFDGNVYETMWELAQRNPLNQPLADGQAQPGIKEFLVPMMERSISAKL